MKPAITMTQAEVKKNLGKDMAQGRYCILEVMCEPSGWPAEPCIGKKRARA